MKSATTEIGRTHLVFLLESFVHGSKKSLDTCYSPLDLELYSRKKDRILFDFKNPDSIQFKTYHQNKWKYHNLRESGSDVK